MRVPPPKSVALTLVAGKILVAALAVGALASFAFYAHQLFLKYPPVWPDESLFANAALNLLRHKALATDLLAGIVPGVERRTYLMPPAYFFYLGSVFSVWGGSVFAVRLASLAAALLVMGLVFSLGLRTGLGPWLSLIPLSLLAVDSVFLRAALIGRMDVLALAFILLALRLSIPVAPRLAGAQEEIPTGRRRHNAARQSSCFPGAPFLTGLMCAMAFLTHPVGAVAVLAVVAAWAQLPSARRWPSLARMLAGFSLPMSAWGVYILQDPGSFIAQFGSQLMRKAGRHPGTLDRLAGSLALNFGQYGLARELPGLVWACGLVGLYLAARKRRELLVLCAAQILVLAAILWSREIWYPVYLAPLTALGLGLLMAVGTPWGPGKAWLPCAALFVSVVFARGSLRHLADINALQNQIHRNETNYEAFCKDISAVIPAGSRTLISVIPDPYLELAKRSDLVLREFVPEGFPVDRGQYRRYLAAADYIVAGLPAAPSVEVSEFLQRRGELVATAGKDDGVGYYARIYRVKR
jgi:hypothetical protein